MWESECEREREREKECVCASVCVRESVFVCEREWEKKKCVCARVCVQEDGYMLVLKRLCPRMFVSLCVSVHAYVHSSIDPIEAQGIQGQHRNGWGFKWVTGATGENQWVMPQFEASISHSWTYSLMYRWTHTRTLSLSFSPSILTLLVYHSFINAIPCFFPHCWLCGLIGSQTVKLLKLLYAILTVRLNGPQGHIMDQHPASSMCDSQAVYFAGEDELKPCSVLKFLITWIRSLRGLFFLNDPSESSHQNTQSSAIF